MAAFHSWTRDPARPLADHLAGRGDLDAEQRGVVEALVALHLKKHGGDPVRSLAALDPGPATRRGLAGLDDPEVGATLARAGLGSTEPGDDPDQSVSYAVGATAGDGRRFRIVRPHARGGLGAVFVAVDGELNREVALKQILDRFADDPQSRARFVLEAEITGGLEHPGIVPVYGLGHHDDGRPYYAMRFIRGDSLKDAIVAFHAREHAGREAGARSLGLRQLLRRFLDVCNAIDYAHSRGVLHRDLKPGNVIVGKHGETLVVDWGLAKATGRADPTAGERPLQPGSASGSAETLPGSALGTPAYMSPEQAAGDLDRLGPASDVYGLGAVLYSVLTGRAPFEGDDVAAVLDRVRRGDFPPPRQVDRTIDVALEAVCLKAMVPRPEGRYGTPRALAEDLERWLADEPVSARRDPLPTRLARWARRHRTPVAGAAALLMTAVVGLSAGTVLLGRANAKTEAQRRRAEANYRLARDTVNQFSTQVSENTLLKSPLPGLQPLRRELLQTALRYNQAFVDQGGDDSALKADLARAFFRMGEISRDIGTTPESLAHFERARALWEGLTAAEPGNAAYRHGLAQALRRIGTAQGEQLGRAGESRAALDRALALFEALHRADPDREEYLDGLARVYANLGIWYDTRQEIDEIRVATEKSLDASERLARLRPGARREVAGMTMTLGYWHTRFGQVADALRLLDRSRQLFDDLAREAPEDPGLRDELRRVHTNFGFLHAARTGDLAEALRHYDLARDFAAANARANPSVVEYQLQWAMTYAQPADVLRRTRAFDRGIADCGEAIRILEATRARDPESRRIPMADAVAHLHLGLLLRDSGRLEAAREAFEAAIALFRRADENATHYPDVATCYQMLSDVQDDLGRRSEAIVSITKAIAVLKPQGDSDHIAPLVVTQLAQCQRQLGGLLRADGRPGEAAAAYRESAHARTPTRPHPAEVLHAGRRPDVARGRDHGRGGGGKPRGGSRRGRGSGGPAAGRRGGVSRRRGDPSGPRPRPAAIAPRLPAPAAGPGHAGRPVRPLRRTGLSAPDPVLPACDLSCRCAFRTQRRTRPQVGRRGRSDAR